jgi:hypothetical protein
MNTILLFRSIFIKSLKLSLINSIYYTTPLALFLIACNFLFESVEGYFFNWLIVVIPTGMVWTCGNLYELMVFLNTQKEHEEPVKFYITKHRILDVSNRKIISH